MRYYLGTRASAVTATDVAACGRSRHGRRHNNYYCYYCYCYYYTIIIVYVIVFNDITICYYYYCYYYIILYYIISLLLYYMLLLLLLFFALVTTTRLVPARPRLIVWWGLFSCGVVVQPVAIPTFSISRLSEAIRLWHSLCIQGFHLWYPSVGLESQSPEVLDLSVKAALYYTILWYRLV